MFKLLIKNISFLYMNFNLLSRNSKSTENSKNRERGSKKNKLILLDLES